MDLQHASRVYRSWKAAESALKQDLNNPSQLSKVKLDRTSCLTLVKADSEYEKS